MGSYPRAFSPSCLPLLTLVCLLWDNASHASQLPRHPGETPGTSVSRLNPFSHPGGTPFIQAPEDPFLRSAIVLRLSEKTFLKTHYSEKKEEPRDLTSLAEERVRRGLLRLQITSPLLDGRLHSEGELAYAIHNTDTADGFGKPQNQLVRLRLKGDWAGLDYGAEYRYVGKRFFSLGGPSVTSDREGGEFWGERQFGVMRLKTSLGAFWDNLENEVDRPRNTEIHGRISTEVAFPSWPVLSFSYSRGSRASSKEPAGYVAEKFLTDTFAASLRYGRGNWDGKFSSTASVADDLLGLGRNSLKFDHKLEGRYRPTKSLAMIPSLTLAQERNRSAGTEIATPALALTLNYNNSEQGLRYIASGSLSKQVSREGLPDRTTLGFKTGMDWNLDQKFPKRKTLSIHFDYRHTSDRSLAGGREESLSGWVIFRLAAF